MNRQDALLVGLLAAEPGNGTGPGSDCAGCHSAGGQGHRLWAVAARKQEERTR